MSICLSAMCWVVIILFIVIFIHGIYREFVHWRMYREIQKTTMFKSKFGLLGPYLKGNMAGFEITYKSAQKFSGKKNESLWKIFITITHPNKLFPSTIDKTNPDVIRTLNILHPDSISIKRNRRMDIELSGKPENNEEILHYIQVSILLAKTIDCAK
ncbi:MAG: hypothetical protein KKH41_02960 [Candidatus Thermoplasmatota archaeon]|nr:hypothetical protein [Euryarchaeota archaeon]MBU4591524.1 hypothetical protein [Candidatus Thermoplasmatota archaeon]